MADFKELNTAYKDIATDKIYEDAWFARAKSDVSSDGTNMYYVYDSTNLIKRLNDSKQDQTTTSKEDTKYKLVSHPITNTDSGAGDTDYNTLIDFTYKPNSDKDDTVVQVYNPKTKKMETNDMLTELYAKHAEQADIYPSIAITCAQYKGKLYFNLSNYILSYDLTSGEVATVKKYDTVYGKRDKTNAFGGMSFALVNSADGADFTFRDHPIAGISLKSDGKLYVSVATNLAYISGKDDVSNRTKSTDSKDYTIDSKNNGYGYEFEESNYNPDYNSYINDKYSDSMMEQFGYTREINDNDEFMWVANLRGTEAMSSIAGESVEYKKETCDHHYIHFDETYFTKKKDSDGNKTDEWNTGESYVCTVCGKSVEEPTEPKKNSMGSNSDYEKKKEQYDKDKAEYDEVVKNAGHTYTAKDPKWTKNDDGTYSVTFDTLVCSSVCEKEKNQRDCLVNDDTITIKLNNPVTAQAEITKTEGACTDEGGVKVTYTATGEAEGHKYTVSNVVETGKGEHTLKSEFKWTKLEDGGYSATVSAKCEVCGAEEKDVQAEVTSVTKDATCTEDAQITYTAKATCLGQELTETKAAEVQEGTALGHDYKKSIVWNNDKTAATGEFTCSRCDFKEEVPAEVKTETKPATCTENGETTAYAKAELKDKDGKVIQTVESTVVTETIPALGHDYESKFDWAEDGSSAKLTLTCKRGDDKQTVDAVITKDEKSSVAPTCTEAGKNVFVATATYDGKDYTDTKEVEVPALGHKYKGAIKWSEDFKSADATFTCETCKDVQTAKADVTAKTDNATCTTGGKVTYTAKAELKDKNGKVLATATDTKETTVDALGHDYKAKFDWAEDGSSAKLTLTCKRGDDTQSVDAVVTKDESSCVAPTCTEAGKNVFTATATYEGKEYTDTYTVELPATGHTYKGDGVIVWGENNKSAVGQFTCDACKAVTEVKADIKNESKAATCTEDGITKTIATAELKDKDGKVLATATDSKETVIKATGHDYDAKFTWAEDGSSATVALTCKKCNDKQNPKVTTVKDEKSSVAPTCTEAGKNVFHATVEGYDFTDTKEVELPALGHKYKGAIKWSEDFKSANAEFTCETCKDVQTVKADVTEKTDNATCTTGGKVTYTAKAELKDKNGKVLATATDTKEITVDALGHDYESKFDWAEDGSSAKLTLTCKRCNDKQTPEVKVAKDEKSSVAPTCTEAGKNVFVATATYDGKDYTDTKEVEVPALGHKYKGAIKWSEDFKSANAEFTCETCQDVQTVKADVTEKTDNATCTTGGKVTYTAKAELKDKNGKVLATATDTKEITVDALGHDYESKFDWAEDGSSAKLTLTCKRGDDKQTPEVKVAKDEKNSVAATCDKAGKNVFVATATYDGKDYTDTKEVEVPALGHKYKGAIKWSEDFKSATAEFTCETCKDVQTVKADVTVKTDNATCTTGGKVTYTAKAELKDKNGKVLATATDTKETTVDALGHDYESKFDWAEDGSSAKLTLTCKRCNDKQTPEVKVAKDEQNSVAATCDKAGKNVFVATATYDSKDYTDTKEVEVPALGHKYKGEIKWSEDFKSADATFTCETCKDVQTVKADVAAKTDDATCTTGGKVTYTAKAELKDKDGKVLATATESKTVDVQALGHEYESKFDWAEDASSAKATLTCKRGDDKQTVDAVITKDEKSSVAPTCTEAGKNVFVATATYDGKDYTDTKEVEVPALGHHYVDGVCDRCGAIKLPFTDVNEGDWFYDKVAYVYHHKLMTGTSETTFEPNATLTRAMMVQILYNKEGRPAATTNGNPYTDVPKDQWYYNAVQWAYENKITSGTSETTFEPNSEVTREQFARFMYNYAGNPAVSGKLDFVDADQVSDWAYDAMVWANQNNIILGKKKSDGSVVLDPRGNATRAEAATILMGYCKAQENQ